MYHEPLSLQYDDFGIRSESNANKIVGYRGIDIPTIAKNTFTLMTWIRVDLDLYESNFGEEIYKNRWSIPIFGNYDFQEFPEGAENISFKCNIIGDIYENTYTPNNQRLAAGLIPDRDIPTTFPEGAGTPHYYILEYIIRAKKKMKHF